MYIIYIIPYTYIFVGTVVLVNKHFTSRRPNQERVVIKIKINPIGIFAPKHPVQDTLPLPCSNFPPDQPSVPPPHFPWVHLNTFHFSNIYVPLLMLLSYSRLPWNQPAASKILADFSSPPFQLLNITSSRQFGEIFQINSWETYCDVSYSLLYSGLTVH